MPRPVKIRARAADTVATWEIQLEVRKCGTSARRIGPGERHNEVLIRQRQRRATVQSHQDC